MQQHSSFRAGLQGVALAAALTAGLAATPAPAAARDNDSRLQQSSDVRDRNGNRVGRLDRQSDGDVIQRDRSGNRTGTLQSDRSGGYIVRDQHGMRTGAISAPR